MKKQPICSITLFEKDMEVEVRNKRTSSTKEGVVTEINLIRRCRMIDGRPTWNTRVAEVVIIFDDGEKCVLTIENFKQYKVMKI